MKLSQILSFLRLRWQSFSPPQLQHFLPAMWEEFWLQFWWRNFISRTLIPQLILNWNPTMFRLEFNSRFITFKLVRLVADQLWFLFLGRGVRGKSVSMLPPGWKQSPKQQDKMKLLTSTYLLTDSSLFLLLPRLPSVEGFTIANFASDMKRLIAFGAGGVRTC